jgi:acyl-coenzyme A thioesterase PaaI-like protein
VVAQAEGNESHGDIRTMTPAEHWDHFAKSWVALQSYTYLGKETPVMDLGVERETMPLRHDMRNSTGGMMAAPLCIAAPEPWWRDDECVPAPVTMAYDILDPAHDVRRVEVLREVISIGRQMGFSRSRIVDADNHERVIAVSSGSGVSLGDVPPGFYSVHNPVTELDDSPDLPRLRDVFGVVDGPNGSLEIARVTPARSSPHSALHIGPIVIALEAAAMDEIQRVTGTPDFQVEHWHVMFVKPGYVGPFRARASVVGETTSTRVGVEATMVDVGADNRVVATVNASFRRAPSGA